MRLIIAENGNNAWLAHLTPHLNVRADFMDMETGIKPKQIMEPSICDSIPGGLSGLQTTTCTPQFMYLYDV